jgi:hypothetical protein
MAGYQELWTRICSVIPLEPLDKEIIPMVNVVGIFLDASHMMPSLLSSRLRTSDLCEGLPVGEACITDGILR